MDRIADGGGRGTDIPIGSNIPCSSCYTVFKKASPRQRFCSQECRKVYWKKNRTSYLKSKARDRTGQLADCKRCEAGFIRESTNQEYCPPCRIIMRPSKGRREYEESTMNELVNDQLNEEGF